MTSKYREIQFSDADVVNPDDFIPKGESNPHNVRPWLIHDAGFPVCVVFASCEQDAWDEAVDGDKLDPWMVDLADPTDRADYLTTDRESWQDAECPDWIGADGVKMWWTRGREPATLGNAGEPFDLDTLGMVELPNPPFSFVALFNAAGVKE